jgi:hypothetical protein
MNPWTRTGSAVVGVALAGTISGNLFAVRQRWVGDAALYAHWINGVAASVLAAALVLSWFERARGLRRRLPRPVALALATTLAMLSLGLYVAFGDVQFPYHRWDQFHYYIGAKYLPELDYTRIYECTAVAEAERFGRLAVAHRTIRDMATEALVPATTALADPDACKRHFSPERWSAFVDDVMWFRGDSPSRDYWTRMQGDHGYNGAPTWSIAGGALASLAPASARTQTALALIDPLLLGLTFGLIGWAFGSHAVWLALIVWGCQFPAKGAWTFGAFLRQDWLLGVVASVCLAKRERWVASGVALASAAALRLFPALLLGMPLLVAVRRWLRARTVERGDVRFALGFVIGAVLWLSASTVIYGITTWRDFAQHIVLHNAEPLANHIGLRAILSQTVDGRLAATQNLLAADPYHVWKVRRLEAFAARKPLYHLLLAGVVILAAVGAGRIRTLWRALAGSTVLVVCFLDVASYYCAFFVILTFLAEDDPWQEWLAIGAVLIGRLVNAAPFVADSPDMRYAAQSVVFVAWPLLALVRLAWGPDSVGWTATAEQRPSLSGSVASG